ncbi:MAG: thiamine-phosphate kinase [Rikenellaceae bacterium]
MTEFGFIDKLGEIFATIGSQHGFEGIGDDCAVLPLTGGDTLVFTTDMLVEDVHFLREATSPYDLGRKSLAVNLSDVAAMGAKPIATLSSISVPKELMGEWLNDFMRGYRDLSAEHSVALIGGDTTGSKSGKFTINVTAIGRCPQSCLKRRAAAKVGDAIYVTGSLGGSGAGLKDILDGKFDTELAMLHKNPTPRIAEGEWLGAQSSVNAMMDISDGIGSDLRHILKLSNVGAEVELRSIPIYNELVTLEQALSAGEDYELLFTASSDFDPLSAPFAVTAIGKITAGEGIKWLSDGTATTLEFRGFNHY